MSYVKNKLRKPLIKPNQYCMNIIGKENINDEKTKIEKFVINLYTNKKLDKPFEKNDINVIFDMMGKRVCVELTNKINANYIKIEDIHATIKPKNLKIDKDFTLSKPESNIFVHHLDSTSKLKVPEGDIWKMLSHNGPYLSWIIEPYKPHEIPLIYEGKKYKLSPDAEQAANFWVQQLQTEDNGGVKETTNKTFYTNFWKDFKTYLSPEYKSIIKDLSKIDFSLIKSKMNLIKNEKDDSQKKLNKKKTAEIKYGYGYAIVNGVKEEITGYIMENSSIFKGRGDNLNKGRIKRNINPSEITINIGKGEKIPDAPKGKWKEIVHDTKARWLWKWSDPITGKPKYTYMSAEGQFKSDSDSDKFENARKLNMFLEDVRKEYKKNLTSSYKQERQLATVLSLVDKYGIRMGGEKNELEAKTYGASTLLVDHIDFKKDDVIHLNFLGKDSILYDKKLEVDQQVYKNLKDFYKGKSKKSLLFELVSACDINNYLKRFDKGFSGKVFRTRLASTLMYHELANIKITKKTTIDKKKKIFVDANIIIAKTLNHKKAIVKGYDESLSKIKTQLKNLEEELKKKNSENSNTKSLQKRIKEKKDLIDDKNKLKTVANSTSLTNYIDPRLVTAWCKTNDVPIEKIYTKTLLNKFKWAIDKTDFDWDYIKTPLLDNFKTLQPEKEYEICEKKKSSGNSKKIKLLKEYRNILKNYGCILTKKNGNFVIKKVKTEVLNMQDISEYKNIYDMSKSLVDEGLGILSILLIEKLFHEATNKPDIKKTLIKSGYIDDIIHIVKSL